MLSSQLFWRVFSVYAGLTVCSALAFVVLLTSRHQQTVYQQVEQRLRDDAAIIRQIVRWSPDAISTTQALRSPEIQRELSRLQLADGGHVEFYSDANAPTAPFQKAIRAASENETGDGFELVSYGPNQPATMAYAVRVPAAGEDPTYIVVSVPLANIDAGILALSSRIWATALLIGAVTMIITYLVVGRIIWPLETLTQAAERLSSGQLSPEVGVTSTNEIGVLAKAFNLMSRQLSARISDLQTESRKLEQNNEQLATVLGAMVEGVVAIDSNERLILANEAAIRLLDLKPKSIQNRPFWESVRIPQVVKVVREVLDGESTQRAEFDVPRTHSTVAMVASPLPGDPSPGVVLVLHDVTELRRLENLRHEFVANVSHELKTPLAAIGAYTETLLDGAIDDPKYSREFLKRIDEQSTRLHTLILDLLNLGRLESQAEPFELVPLDLAPVVVGSLESHEAVAQAKGISLTCVGLDAELKVLGDDEALQTIIDNLLDNALNYTPEGGRVTVHVRPTGDAVELEVEDTGVGIAKEHQTRIFERFYRIDRARSREVGGTGLGLSIVKHLCQILGGSVRVQSQLGEGSSFIVTLQRYVPGAITAPGREPQLPQSNVFINTISQATPVPALPG